MIGENAVDSRPKNFLTEAEMESFLKAARKGRHGARNFAMMLMAYRHGLRVSELINVRMADVDLDSGRLFVRRVKRSLSTSQPLEGDEIRALRAWLRQRINAPCCNSPLLFLSERGPMTRQAVNYVVAELANALISRSAFTHTCSGIAAGLRSPTKAATRGWSKIFSDIGTSGTRSFTRVRPPYDLKGCGIDLACSFARRFVFALN